MEPQTWLEALADQWDSPLFLELQPAAEEWSSEWLLPAHALSSALEVQALSRQGSAALSAEKIGEEYWKEPDLPW